MKKGFSNLIINFLRKTVDKYDQSHNLKTRKVFQCKNADTRNRYKRKEFVIPEDQPQCPVYKDNRCCGCCDYSPTCDYAVNCNCYGFAYACLGGTDEGYYMRDEYSSKYGRIDNEGKFDWNYYKVSKKRDIFKPGVISSIDKLEDLLCEESITFIKENKIRYVVLVNEPDSEGYVTIDCSMHEIDKQLNVNILGLHEYLENKDTVKKYIAMGI